MERQDRQQDTPETLTVRVARDLFGLCQGRAFPQPGPQRERLAWTYMRSLLDELHGMHSLVGAHGGICLESALLRRVPQDGTADARDVYLGAQFQMDPEASRAFAGRQPYKAPEMHAPDNYDARAADLFSLGVLAYALAFGQLPWNFTVAEKCKAFAFYEQNGLTALLQRRRVGRSRRLAHECVSGEYVKLLDVLLSIEPSARRLGAQQLETLGGGQ